MANYKRTFVDYCDKEGIRYTDLDDHSMKIVYTGDNLNSIPIFVSFDKEGGPTVSFRCWNIANFSKSPANGILVCNDMNAKWKWVKFYIDDDRDVIAEVDVRLNDYTCAALCHATLRSIVNIVDEAYPEFMKSLWV